MRRLVAVTLVVVGLLLLPADAHAQGFWRWLEYLSGPEISGPGFDIVFACRGQKRLPVSTLAQPQYDDTQDWFFSPYCVDAKRDTFWISIGSAVYMLAGDNNQTNEPDDRVDLSAVMPFVDFNWSFGLAASAGVGIRHYEAGASSFNKAVTEFVGKARPLRIVAALRGTTAQGPSLAQDLIEVRFGAVYQSAFEAGQFGPGTPALDGDFSKVFVLAFNLVR